MKPKTLVLLAVAGGCGLVAMLGVQQVMQGSQSSKKVETSKVLVALDNIDTGMKLTENNVTFKNMPKGLVPEDAVTTAEDFVDRAAKVPLIAGDVVRKSKLTEKGEWGKSVAIPPGMRVIGIPVDDSHTISGLIRPGDRVDVLVTYQGRGERGSPVSKTKTLLEYVEVFSMDDQVASKLEDKSKGMRAKIASLIVTPEQAGYLILAQRKGTLSLSWRRRGDDELAQTKAIDEKLMEELEGTVGMHDSADSFYDRHRSFTEENDDFDDGQSAHDFLNENSEKAPATVQAPVVEAAPPVPTWTVEIFNGSESVPQLFELPLEEGGEAREITPPAGMSPKTASLPPSLSGDHSSNDHPKKGNADDKLPENVEKAMKKLGDPEDWNQSFDKLKTQLAF